MDTRKLIIGLTLFALIIIPTTAAKRLKRKNKAEVEASQDAQENINSDLSVNTTESAAGGIKEIGNAVGLPTSNITQTDMAEDVMQNKKGKKAHRMKHRRTHKRKHLKRVHKNKRPKTDAEAPDLQTAGIMENGNGEIPKDINGEPLPQQRGRNHKKSDKHHQRQQRRLHRRKMREHKKQSVVSNQAETAIVPEP